MQVPPRPALLTVGMVLSVLLGAVLLIFLPLAAIGFGSFTIEEEAVSGPEFLRRAGLLWATIGGLLVAISYTLARQRPVSRHLMIAYWIVIGFSTVVSALVQKSGNFDLTWLPPLAIAVWYLYFKPNVVAYYAAISQPAPTRLPFDLPPGS